MSADDGRVVFRTSQPDEAPVIAERLSDAGIPFEIRIVVQDEREGDALALIEAHMRLIGSEPAADAAQPPHEDDADLLPCPNCERVGIRLGAACGGCGFAVTSLKSAPAPVDGRSFCPECRQPTTFPSGTCADCGVELEPLEPADRLCPEKGVHVLYRDTKGGAACPACKVVWADVG
ncbi:MAG: hypothetical protein M0D55_14990 [Elusimicrobiota bacterium]|nr:MAG: hypothetical protein M0D55_14990 [Elusimicrobiota bacterium]